jgi:DNA-binding transcriptional LysR family regulator
METLANLDSFVRSAELRSFSAAARRLSITPAAVSRNVAMLERNLGVRLFQRSTRRLTLTEAGDRLLPAIRNNLDELQAALASASSDGAAPAGTLKVSMSLNFGVNYIVPLLPKFLARYPLVRPDWRFDSRQVDLVAEGYDAAIGGGFELPSGMISRTLVPLHVIAVASPKYMKGRRAPSEPADLAALDGIVMRSPTTGRAVHRVLRNAGGVEVPAPLSESIMLTDPAAMLRAALLGLGVTMLGVHAALSELERGSLGRLLPQ